MIKKDAKYCTPAVEMLIPVDELIINPKLLAIKEGTITMTDELKEILLQRRVRAAQIRRQKEFETILALRSKRKN